MIIAWDCIDLVSGSTLKMKKLQPDLCGSEEQWFQHTASLSALSEKSFNWYQMVIGADKESQKLE